MAENLSALFTNSTNRSIPKPSIYIFTPAGSTTKQALVFSMVTVALIGFVGGNLILHFLSQNKHPIVIQSSRFIKNLNLYIKSLALSDILSTLVSLPLKCIQISFDHFQTHWTCKIVRYFNIVFPVITIYNLFSRNRNWKAPFVEESATDLERYSGSQVDLPCLVCWICSSSDSCYNIYWNKARFEWNKFTVICKYDTEYLPARIAFVSFTALVYYLPGIFLIVVNTLLVRKVHLRLKVNMMVFIQVDKSKQAKLRAAKIRGTVLLITMTFAFIIPYFGYMGYAAYNMIAKPDIDFQTDYVIRFSSGVIAFSNSAVNLVIYVVQMRGFRIFLKKLVCSARPAVIPKQFDNAAKLDRGQRHIVHRLLKWLNWANTLNLLCIYFIRSYG